jgi:hypothetical protein
LTLRHRSQAQITGHPDGIDRQNPSDIAYLSLEGAAFPQDEPTPHCLRVPRAAPGAAAPQLNGLVLLKGPAELIEQDNRFSREGFWERVAVRDRRHGFLNEIPRSREVIRYGHERAGFPHPLQDRHGTAALNSPQPELEAFSEASREALPAGVLPAEKFLGYPYDQLLIRD